MGYTHYWYRVEALPQEGFDGWVEDCCAIIVEALVAGVAVGGWEGRGGEPELTGDIVSFNGTPGHETFAVERVFPQGFRQTDDDGRLFAFCKTARKPYDAVVTACLMALEHRFPEGVKLSSDGDWADWEAGRDLTERALGYRGHGEQQGRPGGAEEDAADDD